MPYFQLRITIDPSGNRNLQFALRLCKKIIRERHEPHEYSFGYEQLNRCGDPCKPHIHFHFVTEFNDLVDPLRAMKKYIHDIALHSFEVKLKYPNWCVQMVEEPTDHAKWLRYPLKEMGSKAIFKSDEYTFEELENVAMSLRREAVERNVIHRNRMLEKKTFFDKLTIHLDKINSDPSGTIILPIVMAYTWRHIFKYYQDQGKSINFTTIDGYTILYLANHGMINSTQAWESYSELSRLENTRCAYKL